MAVRNPADIRNIALVGQSGSGKTTLVERLLFDTKTTQRMGSVEDGSTVSDWSDEEKRHHHSLRPETLHFEHGGKFVNIVDTPGLADFAGHAIACLPAAETVCVVVDAHRGIEPMTRRMMRVAGERNLPRMIVINKIEESAAEPEEVTSAIREEFGSVCIPINLPKQDRSGVVDVFGEHHEGQTLFSSPDEAHTQIIEQVVEVNEELMAEYLEKGDAAALDKKAVHAAFEQALREGHLVPICYLSAKSGAGIDDFLRIIGDLLPSPLEGNPRPFLKSSGEDGDEAEVIPSPDADKPLIAHVFKVTTDPFVGKLGVFRVHQGTLRAKSEVRVGDEKKPIRVGHLLRTQGKEQHEVEALGPGDIGSIAKIDEVHFDAALHDGKTGEGLHLKPLPLPKPMYGLAIELKNHADEGKFGGVIHKLQAEDPCLVVERIAATKQTVMRGLGELHLRVVLEKLHDHYKMDLLTEPPKIAYKETITSKAEGHHRHKKQTGGAGQFGEVYLRVEPLPHDHENGFEFVNATVGGSIPRQFMPAIEKGIRRVLSDGAVAGYPLTGVKVEVYDGKYHAVDSKEIAFITAGRRAFIDAVSKAKPALLEPIVMLEVTVPQGNMGDITGDLSTKRGRVQDTRMLAGDMCTIVAQVPLSELQNYSTELKSITGGAGSYSMEYSHDENTPPHVQQEVIAAFGGHKEED
ncbi:MAG: elongation factor G [Phycisphaerales bacterium]